MAFCPYCGQQNSAEQLACVRCGELIPRISPVQVAMTPTGRAGRTGSFDSIAMTPWGPSSQPLPRPSLSPVAAAPRAPEPAPYAMGGLSQSAMSASNATSYLDPRQVEREMARERIAASQRMRGRTKLVVEQGLILGEQFLLADDELMIGRMDKDSGYCPDIDLSAQDPNYVHRRHAKLVFHSDGTRLTITDMGGRNGAFINNQPLPRNGTMPLKIGDKLRIGRVVMRCVLAPEVDGDERR